MLLLAGRMLRGEYRRYPLFFFYTLLQAGSSVAGFLLGRNYLVYFYFYWASEAVIVVLNFAVLYEVCRDLLRPYAMIRPGINVWLRYTAAVLLAVAVVLAAIEPASGGWWVLGKVLLIEKVVRFAQVGLLLCLFALAAFFRLQWKQFSFGIALGFGLYACVCLAAVAMRGYFGSAQDFIFALSNSLAYNCACVIWLAYAFQTERAPAAAKFAPRGEAFKLQDWNRALGGLLRR